MRFARHRTQVEVGSELEVKQSGVWRSGKVKTINDDDTYDIEMSTDGSVEKVRAGRDA